MAIYNCIVYDKLGKRKSVKLEFDSEEDIELYEISNNIKIINKSEVKQKKLNKIKHKELSIICQQLGMLLCSGCEITQSLNNMKSNCSPKIKSILDNIEYNLKSGNSISESFRNTNMFSDFFINMIKAGEISGNIDDTLLNLSDYYKKEHEFKQKLKTAMLYPTVLAITSFVVIIFMIIYVIPKFELNFSGSSLDIPTSTKLLIESSRFIRNYFEIIITLSLIFIFCIYKYVYKDEKFRLYIEESIFKFKRIRDIVQSIEINKFNRALYMLIKGGVHIVEALNISSGVISNKFMYNKMYISKEALEKGYCISESLALSGVFPEIFISMIAVGEDTGNIDKCLYNSMINYESNIDSLIQKIIKVIEPTIIVVMGLIIGAIVISMMIPMFDAIKAF